MSKSLRVVAFPAVVSVALAGFVVAGSASSPPAAAAAGTPSAPKAPAAASAAKVPVSKGSTTLHLFTNTRQAAVLRSSSFIELGTVDSGRPKIGALTIACKGRPARACRITAAATGATITKAPTGGGASTQKGKGNRTPGGVGGGTPPSPAPAPSPSPAPAPAPAAPSPAPAPAPSPKVDVDVDWNFCVFSDSMCFTISYDMGGDGVRAQPDGSGDTVDGLPSTLRPGI